MPVRDASAPVYNDTGPDVSNKKRQKLALSCAVGDESSERSAGHGAAVPAGTTADKMGGSALGSACPRENSLVKGVRQSRQRAGEDLDK